MKEAPYLGFLVGGGGTRPQPAKVSALLDMVCEDMGADPSAAARYAGMVGFYHRYLPGLHSILAPFHELKGKGADARRIMHSLRFKSAFAVTRHQLATATALARPDYSKPFYIDVDMASSTGAGAILSQRDVDDDPDSHRVLAFWSRRFSSEERRYGVRDQECMGLVDALEVWRHFAVGTRVIVRTDHKSLEWLLNTPHRDGTRVQGFAHKLQGYDVEIQYVPGRDHVGADCMSRNMPPASRLATGGGTERGRLDSRPCIQDRVDEAVGITATMDAADASYTIGHFFKHVSECAMARCLEATGSTSDTAPSATTSHTGSATTSPPAAVHSANAPVNISSYAFAFFVRRHRDSFSILLEQQDQQLHLPSVATHGADAGSKRRQLIRRLQLTYHDSASLVSALQERRAVRHRFRPPGGARVTFYVATLPDDAHAPSTDGCAFSASFHPATSSTFQRLASSVDRAAAWYFEYRCLRATAAHDTPSRGRCRVREVLHVSSVSTVEAGDAVPLDDGRIPPCIDEAPYGPALIDDDASSALASARLYDRLRDSPGLCISVDLEGPRLGSDGYICLIQVAVDGRDKAPPLIYVFDVLRCGSHALGSDGDHTLRAILEDADIPKVLHSCYGDVAALHRQFGIFTRHVFDTSLADSLCLSCSPNKSRGLKKVVNQWVGISATFTYKGSFVHTDSFWDVRPLAHYKFVYAYEDVIHCGQLYLRLRSTLDKLGVLDLALTLSQQRAPPIALRYKHPYHQPPTTVVVALVDATRVVCLQDPASGLYLLPSLPLRPSKTGTIDVKGFAREVWASVMGPPPRQLRASIHNRMKKGVRVGDALLFLCTTSDCAAALAPLVESRSMATESAGERIVYRQQYAHGCSGIGVLPTQVTLFQYLHAQASQVLYPQSPIDDVFTNEEGLPTVHTTVHLNMVGRHVTLSLSVAVRAGSPVAQHSEPTSVLTADASDPAIVANVAPRPDGVIRVAAILHDDTHFFAVTRKKGIAFPSHGVKDDASLEETAAMAFDLYAGVSLRKRPGVNSHSARLLMPHANAFVRTAEANCQLLGIHGNVAYFSWYASQVDGRCLLDHLSSFHASRRMVNGFQMVDRLAAQHPHFHLIRFSPQPDPAPTLDEIERCSRPLVAALECNDAKAMHDVFTRVASERSSATVACAEPSTSTAVAGAVPQHSESLHVIWTPSVVISTDLPSADATCMTGDSTAYVVSVGGGMDSDDTHPSDIPPYDSTEQRLLTAATAYFAAILETQHAATGHAHASPPVLTRADIREAQLAHPATSQYIDYLRVGRALGEASRQDAFFTETAASLFLSNDGLLCVGPERPGALARIVLPPACRRSVFQLYHDFNGHLGVNKVLDYIRHRFYWGERDVMRRNISDHIRACAVCVASKIPKHRAGEYNIAPNGEHPNDVLSGDVFDVGIVFEEYSHTLDFVCHFSRRVTSTAVRGMPTAEGIAKVVIDVIIRQRGKPREIRSDRGSNFIAAAIKELYKRMRIKITSGTAYRHQLVALVERWHATLKQLLLSQRAAGADDDWPSRLALLELAYNAAHCDSIGYSPFFVDCLRQCILPMDSMLAEPPAESTDLPDWVAKVLESQRIVYDAATRSLRQHALRAKKRYDLKRAVTLKLKPGDVVWAVRGEIMDKAPLAKATVPSDGPFVVARALPHDHYVINNLRTRRIHNIMHVERLLLVPKYEPETSAWMLSDGPDGGTWPVHSIVNRRVEDGVVEYRVRWLGFPKNYDKWLSFEHLHSVLDLVSLYDKRHGFTTPPLECEPRASDATPPPASDDAVARKHFRHVPSSGSQQPAATPSPSVPAAEDPPSQNMQLPDTSDAFPIGTRVDVEYPLEDRSWTGTVVKSRVYRPVTASAMPERIITVVYDDPAYHREEFEHGLTNSIVRRHRPPRGEPSCHGSHPTDGKLLRRSSRLHANGHNFDPPAPDARLARRSPRFQSAPVANLASGASAVSPTSHPPPSPPPSPSPVDAEGVRSFDLRAHPRVLPWVALAASPAFVNWLQLEQPITPVGLKERTWTYQGYTHLFSPNSSASLQPLEWTSARPTHSIGFESVTAFADALRELGFLVLRRIVPRSALADFALMAVQATAMEPFAERGAHCDRRSEGRVILTLTIAGDGIAHYEDRTRPGVFHPMPQSTGDAYAIWGPYVLASDCREDPQRTPRHNVTAGAAGRLSLTFRFGYTESALPPSAKYHAKPTTLGLPTPPPSPPAPQRMERLAVTTLTRELSSSAMAHCPSTPPPPAVFSTLRVALASCLGVAPSFVTRFASSPPAPVADPRCACPHAISWFDGCCNRIVGNHGDLCIDCQDVDLERCSCDCYTCRHIGGPPPSPPHSPASPADPFRRHAAALLIQQEWRCSRMILATVIQQTNRGQRIYTQEFHYLTSTVSDVWACLEATQATHCLILRNTEQLLDGAEDVTLYDLCRRRRLRYVNVISFELRQRL